MAPSYHPRPPRLSLRFPSPILFSVNSFPRFDEDNESSRSTHARSTRESRRSASYEVVRRDTLYAPVRKTTIVEEVEEEEEDTGDDAFYNQDYSMLTRSSSRCSLLADEPSRRKSTSGHDTPILSPNPCHHSKPLGTFIFDFEKGLVISESGSVACSSPVPLQPFHPTSHPVSLTPSTRPLISSPQDPPCDTKPTRVHYGGSIQNWLFNRRKFSCEHEESALKIAYLTHLTHTLWIELELLYFGLWGISQVLAFLLIFHHYSSSLRYLEERMELGMGFILARTSAVMVNITCALILFPVCRVTLTSLRSWKMAHLLPVDQHIRAHRWIGMSIFLWSLIHMGAHYMNIWHLIRRHVVSRVKVALTWAFISPTGATGHILLLLLVIIAFSARRT